jgi:hypothetical protein
MASGLSAVVLCGGAVLAALGVALLIGGLGVARRGDTPFCRQCGYNLTLVTRNK